MKMKHLLLAITVAMFFATGLTYGQRLSRPLPIYRYMVCGAPDNLNVMDSSAASLAQDTTSMPYPVGPALTYGGWDTAHLQTTNNYNWVISAYHPTSTETYYELIGSGYSGGVPIATDQWYISPDFNTNNYTGVDFSFSSKAATYVGPPMIVMVSTSYTGGKPDPAQWDTLKTANIPVHGTAGWKKSHINLDSYKGNNVCVAFRYTSTTGGDARYYVDSIKITYTTGIKEITANDMVSIYPNPVTSTLTISNTNTINKIEIYNMVGEVVSAVENVNKNTYAINVENLQNGLYFAKIQLKNGTIVSKKIIKE
jgi:hypothetical protein